MIACTKLDCTSLLVLGVVPVRQCMPNVYIKKDSGIIRHLVPMNLIHATLDCVYDLKKLCPSRSIPVFHSTDSRHPKE